MEIKDRIEHIMRSQNVTATQLADMMGIQRSGISHILSGRNNPSMDFIVKFKDVFPEYNLDWLLTGAGPKTAFDKERQQKASSIQPSLFEEEENEVPIEEKLEERKEIEQINVETPAIAQKTVEQHEAKPPEEAAHTNILPQSSEKRLTRIALFYTDGSFEMFEAD